MQDLVTIKPEYLEVVARRYYNQNTQDQHINRAIKALSEVLPLVHQSILYRYVVLTKDLGGFEVKEHEINRIFST